MIIFILRQWKRFYQWFKVLLFGKKCLICQKKHRRRNTLLCSLKCEVVFKIEQQKFQGHKIIEIVRKVVG